MVEQLIIEKPEIVVEEVTEVTHEIIEEVVIIEECLDPLNDDDMSLNDIIPLLPNRTHQSTVTDNPLNSDIRKPNKPKPQTCTITSGWKCPRFGRHPHPANCRKYIQCTFGGENTVYNCGFNEAFDPKANRCTDDWISCASLAKCKYDKELLIDPYDKASYFICVRQRGVAGKKKNFRIYRRQCPRGRIFDIVKQRCVLIKS